MKTDKARSNKVVSKNYVTNNFVTYYIRTFLIGCKVTTFCKNREEYAPLFVKTERNDLHNRYKTYILNKSSIVTTLCTLPEYSLRDNEYVVTRVMCIEERHFVSSINVVSLWRKSASHDLSI